MFSNLSNGFLWNRTYIVRTQSNLKLEDQSNTENLSSIETKFNQKFGTSYSQLDEDNNLIDIKQNKKNEIDSELVEDFDRLVHDTNKEQAKILKESLKNCKVSQLIDEGGETNLPIYVENFLSSNEKVLRRWYDYLDLTNPLRQKFNSYEELSEALSSNVGTDEGVVLAKDSFNSLLISSDDNLRTVIHKSMGDNNKLMDKILEFFNSTNPNHENNLSESLSSFNNQLTKVEQLGVGLNNINSASDVKDILSNFITEMFKKLSQDYLDQLSTLSKDVTNLKVKPRWYKEEGTEVIEIDLQVLGHDKELLQAIESSIKENKVISSEGGWLGQEDYNYNLPTRQQGVDDYVSSGKELMLNKTANKIEDGLNWLDQLMSSFEKSGDFFVKMTQMYSEQLDLLKSILLELGASNQGSLMVVIITFLLLMTRTLGKRLIRNYLLWQQVPWAILFKMIGGLFLGSGATLILGKGKGGGNFILKFVSMYLGIDDMANSLMSDFTGLDVQTAKRTVEWFFGGFSMLFGSILFLFARSEEGLANDLRFILQGMKKLPGYGLLDSFRRNKLIEKHEEVVDNLESTSKGREEVADVKLELENETESNNKMSEKELDEFSKESDKYVESHKKKIDELILEWGLLKEKGDDINSKKKMEEILGEKYSLSFAQDRIDKVKKGTQDFLFP